MCNIELDNVQKIGKKWSKNLYFLFGEKIKAHDGIYVNYSKDAREKGLP